MSGLIMVWVFGAIPILAISWLLRRVARKPLTPKVAVASVVAATVIAYVIRSFAEGEGGFANRISRIGSADELLLVIPQGLIALALALFSAISSGNKTA